MVANLTGQGFGEREACRVVGVNRSSYVYWRRRPPNARELRRAWLGPLVAQIHRRGELGVLSARGARHLSVIDPVLVDPAVDGGVGEAVVGGQLRNGRPRPRHRDDSLTKLLRVLLWDIDSFGDAGVSSIVIQSAGVRSDGPMNGVRSDARNGPGR